MNCISKLGQVVFSLWILTGCGQQNPPVSASVMVQPAIVATRPASMPATTQITGDQFPVTTNPRETIGFLASDALAGRLPGSPGLQRAGDFLASELTRVGLQPLPGHADFFQPFSMNDASALAPSTNLIVNGEKMVLAKDYDPIYLSAETTFTGKVVFAGFGITREKDDPTHYDDYAGIDAHGKIVLAMMKEPLDEKGASRFAG